MGCGRTGSRVAASLAGEGDSVTVVEKVPKQVARLPQSLVDDGTISIVIGDGTTTESLRQAEIEEADVFVAIAGSDTVNGLAAQKAKEIFGVGQVILRVKDPALGEMYTARGLEILSTTDVSVSHVVSSVSRSR